MTMYAYPFKHYLRDIIPKGGRYVCADDERSGIEPDGRVFILSNRRKVGSSEIAREF